MKLDDPVFGRIAFDQGIWTFIPSLLTVGFMVTIDAPETGPTTEQRALFQEIRSILMRFEERARDYMRPRVEMGLDVSRLSTYSIGIGNVEETAHQEFVLELSDSEAIVIHRVAFRTGEPVDYGFDD